MNANHSRIIGITAALLMLGLAAACKAQRPAAAPAQEWRTYDHDLAGTRFSPLTDINTGNVAKLTTAWTYNFPAPPAGRGGGGLLSGSEAVPLVVAGVVYLSATNTVVALEADTGTMVWQREIGAGTQPGAVSRRGGSPLSFTLDHIGRNRLKPEDQVVLEATTHCWAVVRALEPFVARVVVSNPMATKAIAKAKVKTDKVDASVLAHLLRLGYLPEVWQPDHATRDLREWTARRSRIVGQRTSVIIACGARWRRDCFIALTR